MQPAASLRILVAEDEPEIRSYLDLALRAQGYTVELASNGDEALKRLGDSGREISLLLLDIFMPRKDGIETLREIRRVNTDLPVIVISGTTSPLKAVEAMKNGATDFLAKPVSHEQLSEAIRKALALRIDLKPDIARTPLDGAYFCFGNSARKKIESVLDQIGASDLPVLLQGETGVGKEVLARQLHARSSRASAPFLKVNCAALPSELVESELFGYERGAFTGAFKSKPGKFELAEDGAILLDEIGDMDFKLQAKLLQVLQDHEFQRLGGKETVRVNVRVMAATHCNLEQAMRDRHFREDLYYRLNVVNVHLPSLRECKDELRRMADFFLHKHAAGAVIPGITPELEHAMLAYDWPGNIRELENFMRRLLVFRNPGSLAEELTSRQARRSGAPVAAAPVPDPQPAPGQETELASPIWEKVKLAETDAILSALKATRWNRKQAAKLLHMNYKPFLYKMRKLGIEKMPL